MILCLLSLLSAWAQTPAAPEVGVAAVGSAAEAEAPLAIDPADLLGAPAGPPVSGDVLRERTNAVSELLRCPVCQGTSVADSPAESALAMKREVQDLVAKGYDTEQVLLYFESSYGEFIRLEPTTEGMNVLVWALPVVLLAAGALGIGASVRRRGVAPAAHASAPAATVPIRADPAPADPALAAASLAEHLRRVREDTR